MELRPKGLVCGFSQAMGGKVQWNSEALVLLGGGSQPLLASSRFEAMRRMA